MTDNNVHARGLKNYRRSVTCTDIDFKITYLTTPQ